MAHGPAEASLDWAPHLRLRDHGPAWPTLTAPLPACASGRSPRLCLATPLCFLHTSKGRRRLHACSWGVTGWALASAPHPDSLGPP